MVGYLLAGAQGWERSRPVTVARRNAVLLRGASAATLAFIYAPLIVIGLYAFNESVSLGWPIGGRDAPVVPGAIDNPGVRDALWVSLKAALGATAIALLLGTLAAMAVARYCFFGRETISFVVMLPIALPGIVTGMALNSTFRNLPELRRRASAS